MSKNNNEEKVIEKIARFIVEKRKAFYLIFIITIIFCAGSISKVKINSDLSKYLPEGTETKVGLQIMEDEFTTYASAQIMISNITFDKADQFAESFEDIDGVMMVTFENTEDHFKDSSALIMVSFKGVTTDSVVEEAMNQIKSSLEGYDVYYNTEVGDDFSKTLESEMAVIMVVAVIVIIAVLIFTSNSYLEIVVFFIVFGVAGVLNMGTNYFLGEISFVTKAIAIILQLALAIDYAIILCHRYMEERQTHDAKDATIKALSKAIIEISSSSLTTISGLLALTTMQFRIGFDMGVVLIKGICCSLITVFLLMPGLLLMFNRGIEKTMHKNFVPKITIWGKFIVKTKYIITPLFLIVFIVSFFLSNKCDYVFSQRFIDTNNPAVNRIAQDKIIDTFGAKNTIALLVPMGDYESEKKILEEISELPRIVTTLGLANIEIDDDHVLTDKFTPRQFSELADVDIELARLLYRAYGLSNEEYGAIFQNVDDYSAPLIKIFLFLVEQRDAGIIALTTEQNEKVDELNSTLQDALVQLEGENWSRLIFMGDVPDESEETYELLDSIRAVAQPYYDKDVVITSNPTLSLDQKNSFSNDNKKISILTVLFVMVILLFTFKSVGLPFMLILTIQGSIFINFSFPYITETNLFFLSFLIVSSIQMGATIDYAILITNRYQSLKTEMNRDDAVVEALNQSFPTIFTSGSILTIAGYLIGSMTTQPIIGSIGLALGRGTLISIILVMTALPQILNIGDVIIEKTALTIKIKKRERVNLDQMRMDGYVKGQVTGYIDGQFKGVIRGNINAEIESNAQESEDDINEK